MEYRFPMEDEMCKNVKDWINHESAVSMAGWKKWNADWIGRFVAIYWNEHEAAVGILVSGTKKKRKIDPNDRSSKAKKVQDIFIRACTPVGVHKESQLWFDLDKGNIFFIDDSILLSKFSISVCVHVLLL